MNRIGPPAVPLALAFAFGALSPAAGQRRDVDFSYGRWWHEPGAAAEIFQASFLRPLADPLWYGFAITHLDDGRSRLDRTQTGGELSLVWRPGASGLYGVGAVGLGVVHRGTQVDGQWSAGVGYGLTPLRFLQIGLEARYRAEDREMRGFWRLTAADRRGLSLRGGVAFRLGGAPAGPGPRPPAVPASAARAGGTPLATSGRLVPPDDGDIVRAAAADGASEDAAAMAGDVVRTALDVMGSPYRWGGTGENGFDCSGLIQFAYQEHGIILPRVSRDQIRTGTRVEPALEHVRPGDILGFAVEGRLVSHVGLYVGDGMFIHSASDGVRLSSLTRQDPNDRWWQRRWVAARRIVN